MAALDFPANPTAGQVYEGENGVIYTYVGTAPNGHWSAFAELSSESFADIFVEVKGDNMTGVLTLGPVGDNKITLNAEDGTIKAGAKAVFGDAATAGTDGGFSTNKGKCSSYLTAYDFSTTTYVSSQACYQTVCKDVTDTGDKYVTGQWLGNGSIRLQPTDSQSQNILLDAENGSITAAGNIGSLKTIYSGPFDPKIDSGSGSRLTASMGVTAQRASTVAGYGSLYAGYRGSTQTFLVGADGRVEVGGVIGSAPNISLKADGSASFAGLINGNGGLQVGDRSFEGAGLGCSLTTNGNIFSTVQGPNYSAFRTFLEGTTAPTVNITGNGSATFASDIISGNYDPSGSTITKAGTKLQADGALLVSTLRDGDAATDISFRIKNPSNANAVTMWGSGKASFAGTVTANGSVLTRANGTTLDLGDRAEKVDAALGSLKTALASISDFAQLKAALVTALADI